MIRIKTPATSANLGVGFDSIAIALSLYNTYVFQPTKTTSFVGFDADHSNPSNLVFQAYVKFVQYCDPTKTVQPVQITLESNDIPMSRGLGSSASCILAGVLASNHIHKLNRSLDDCAQFSADMEGHPDNVYACMFGSLTGVFQHDNKYIHHTFDVLDFIHFTLLIPDVSGQTKQLRKTLPEHVSMEDAVFHLSRMMHLPEAFKHADIAKLKLLLQDRIHEQYRYPSIPMYKQILKRKEDIDGIVLISGSGPSLLVLSDHDITKELSFVNDTFHNVSVKRSSGTTLEVIE